MKTLSRALALGAALGLAAWASASGTAGTCTYKCRNNTTGVITIVTTGASMSACCDGTVICPAGSTYAGTIGYNNGSGLRRCAV